MGHDDATIIEIIQINEEDDRIIGFAGSSRRIKVNFINPARSMTGGLFPSEHRRDDITVT